MTEALLEYARRRFALDKPDAKTGKSRLQTQYDIRKQTGVVTSVLQSLGHVPPETAYLWEWYEALSARRGAGFSVNALSWSDMRAFFYLRRLSPEPWEVDTICAIDTAYLNSRADTTTTGAAQDASALAAQITGKRE